MTELSQQREAIQSALLAWYRQQARPLPWRTQPSLYRTVVSEMMLQQTQVATMLPYFERWMRELPDFASLAKADTEQVLKRWEGLGYYARARNLHKLAKQWTAFTVSERPVTAAEWRQLPGIGPYTSAAIASIAFGEPAAVIDGNVVRVLSRLTQCEAMFSSNAAAVKAFEPLATTLIEASPAPGDHNQALMELGATCCRKGKPDCPSCPLLRFCRSAASKTVSELPRITRKPTVSRQLQRVVALRGGELMLHLRPTDATRLAGYYEFPEIEMSRVAHLTPVFVGKRQIANERITENFYQLELTEALPECHFVALEALEQLPMTGPHRRWWQALRRALDIPD